MKRILILLLVAAVGCVGCSQDKGDVDTARKAALAAPKSAADLPASMPKDARASAAAAMGQAQAAQQANNDPARVHALEMMRKQHH
ncbi:MAG: hypothetical protein P4L46_26240 [Fimbriimonas sp.]|nr:hypothetical protein [Fimbriimonas sp.]